MLPLEKKLIWEEMGIKGDCCFRPRFIKFKEYLKSSDVEDSDEKERIYLENEKIAKHNKTVRGTKNIGRFFSFIYSSIFGGEVLLKNAHYKHKDNPCKPQRGENFQPDLMRFDSVYGEVPTEIKSSSMRYNGFDCPSRQVEQYSNYFIKQLVLNGANSLSEYVFVKYGDRNLSDIAGLPPDKMFESLINEDHKTELLVAPFNLFLFMLAAGSRIYERNMESSMVGGHRNYHIVRGGFFSRLCEGLPELDKIIDEYPRMSVHFPDIIEDLFLDKLKFLKVEPPTITADYLGRTNYLNLSQISKYYLDKEGYDYFISHFKTNHESILGKLGLEDIFAEKLNAAKLEYNDSIRIAATEEGISMKRAFEKYGEFDRNNYIKSIGKNS